MSLYYSGNLEFSPLNDFFDIPALMFYYYQYSFTSGLIMNPILAHLDLFSLVRMRILASIRKS